MRLLLTCLLAIALVACGANTPGATPSPAPAATPAGPSNPTPGTAPAPTAPAATPEPSPPAPTAQPSATAEALPDPAAIAGLQATVEAGLPPTPTTKPGDTPFYTGIVSATVIPLSGAGQGRYAVASSGMRSFEPLQNHFVAIYERAGGEWREVARAELENPDYLDPSGVSQLELTPDAVWIEVQGGVGAHGGCYDLLRLDGPQISHEVTHCAASPGAGGTADIDGDGAPEVLLDNSDPYVSCYACGLRLFHTSALRWDGAAFQELELSELPGDSALAALNNQAVALAEARLWRDALALLPELRKLGKGDQTALTNAGLIELDGQAFADQAAAEGLTPLMPRIFYGDFEGALEHLRGHTPEEIFAPETSQIFGPEVQGFEASMTGYITATTGPALAYNPDLAPAHFLQGWALALASPGDPAALAAIERAAALDPGEPLYAESAAYLRRR